MAPETSPRIVRVGGTTVEPGQARPVSLRLPGRADDAAARDALPVLVIVGRRPGPRVAILAAPRGFETSAAQVAATLAARLRADDVAGVLVIVPVLRPGGRFASGGRPIRRAREWSFPGDPAGRRVERDAAAVFDAIVADASLVLVLSEPNPARAGALALRCDLGDPRARRLAVQSGVPAIGQTPKRRANRTVEGGAHVDAIRLELSIPAATTVVAVETASAAIERLLGQAGVLAHAPGLETPPRRPTIFRRLTAVLARASGLVEVAVGPGDFVAKGMTLARIRATVTGAVTPIVAPHDGLVLEAPARVSARPDAKLFVIARTPRAQGDPRRARAHREGLDATSLGAMPAGAAPERAPLRIGWVESVSLPQLGILRLSAKIDTGARTSALHVAAMKTVGSTPGHHRRPILEIAIPEGRSRTRVPRVVRVQIREFVQIKDTSGRSERRPVIETTLRLGPIERRIRVTLTDRGDMLYPMLVGRTALGAGVVVDPSRRRLLRVLPETRRPRVKARAAAPTTTTGES